MVVRAGDIWLNCCAGFGLGTISEYYHCLSCALGTLCVLLYDTWQDSIRVISWMRRQLRKAGSLAQLTWSLKGTAGV